MQNWEIGEWEMGTERWEMRKDKGGTKGAFEQFSLFNVF